MGQIVLDPHGDEFTRLLDRVYANEPGAIDTLMDVVYTDLRRLAAIHMRRRFKGQGGLTMQPTAIAHETFLKIIKQRNKYDSRGHFFAIATTLLKRVLREYHDERNRQKRGGALVRVTFDRIADIAATEQADIAAREQNVEIPALFEALDRLKELDPFLWEITNYRVLWGCTIKETADALGVGHATVERKWPFVCSWLAKELLEED